MGENTHWQKEIIIHWEELFKKITELLQHRWQWNWIFILKTLFLQKLSNMSFTNPASVAGLQLPNLCLLKVVLRYVNSGVMTLRFGHQTTWKHACDMVRWVILHTVPYIRKNLCLEGSLHSIMPGLVRTIEPATTHLNPVTNLYLKETGRRFTDIGSIVFATSQRSS
jgi:hypothetical protein